MGASDSNSYVVAKSTAITNDIASAIISTNQGCANGVIASQNVVIGTISGSEGISVTQNIEQTADLVCVQTADSTIDFSSDISNAVSTTVKASATAAQAIGSAKASSYVNSQQELITNISKSIDVQTLQTCINNVFSEQNVTIGQILNSKNVPITISSSQKSTVNCVQKQKLAMTAVTTLANQMSQDLSATTSSGFDLGLVLIFIAIIIIVILFGGPTVVINTFFGVVNGVVTGTVGAVKNVVSSVAAPAAPVSYTNIKATTMK